MDLAICAERSTAAAGKASLNSPNRWNMSDVFNVLFKNGFLRPLFFKPPTLSTESNFPLQSQCFVCAMQKCQTDEGSRHVFLAIHA
jgi:hypothetical protein